MGPEQFSNHWLWWKKKRRGVEGDRVGGEGEEEEDGSRTVFQPLVNCD